MAIILAKARRSAVAMTRPSGVTRWLGTLATLALLGLSTILPTAVLAQNSLLDREGSATIDQQIQQGNYVIPNSFFGMHINNVHTPWPTAYFANQRLEGSNVNWWNIEIAPGEYDYYWLDQWLANAQAHNVSLVYTFVGVPQFYSSIPNDQRCTFNVGACDPPRDVNENGSGSDEAFQNFVRDLVRHNAELGYPIRYWEMWNEPDIVKQWIPTCKNKGKKCTGNLEYAQLLRMAKDARAIIKQADPNAVVLSPAPVGFRGAAEWMGGYLAALHQQGGPYPDVVAFHGYVNEWVMGYFPVPENEIQLIDQLKGEARKNGLGTKPLWITEGSWGNTILDGFTDPVLQTAFLARYIVLQQSQGIARGYWYQWDQPGGDGTLWQGPSGNGNWRLTGYAYNSIVNWTRGATLTSACSNRGGSVWACKYARSTPKDYQAEIVWNAKANSIYAVPQGFKQYCDLKGNMTKVQGNKAEIGIWPILLENKNLAKGPCRQY